MRLKAGGFTLIEILAVLLIVALASTLAMVSLRGMRRQATLEDVIGRVLDYDQGTRLYARRFGQAMQLLVSSKGMEQRPEKDKGDALRMPLMLPAGFVLKELWNAGGAPTPGDAPLAIAIGREGCSRSYGFCLSGPQGQNRWIVILGATGQQRVAENDAMFQDILALLARKRIDAP